MVSTALYTGLSGLRVNQTYIDIIGNNLANVSTPGYRGSRATFSDILSFTVRAGSGPNGNFGGLNPLQIGTGSFLASVDQDLSQGTLQSTGRSLDVALQGRGFFTLTNGNQTFYSRVGSFFVDSNRTLVDTRTGLRVLDNQGSTITLPQSDTLPAQATTSISFQGNLPAEVGGPLAEIVESSSPLKSGVAAEKVGTAPAGASFPQFDLTAFAGKKLLVSVNGGAQQTLTVPSSLTTGPVDASDIASWLNGGITGSSGINGATTVGDDPTGTLTIDTNRLGDTASLKFDDGPGSTGLLAALGLDAQLDRGSKAVALDTTPLNSLTVRNSAYVDDDAITIRGTNPDGSVFSDTFVYGSTTGTPPRDGTTVGDLLNFINNTVDGAQCQAELTADGTIRLTASDRGEAELSLFVGDISDGNGAASWPNFTVEQQGTGPDTATTSIDVIDSQGRSHSVSMTFTRNDSDSTIWDLETEIDDAEGTLQQGSIGQIRFNENGSFNVIGGGTNQLSFAWNGLTQAQNVNVKLGTSGQFDGVAMLGSSTTVAAVDQDGYAAGTLLDAGFDTQGQLVGYYSNGQNQTIAQLRISMFSNEAGLVRQGDTLYAESPNSGEAIATVANAAGAGSVRAGNLENSNVDIAREFVSLIEAQRGFQANSRVITTTDQILAELMNIVR